jgi:hypothetical protein
MGSGVAVISLRRLCAAGAVLLVLAGCGSEKQGPSALGAVVGEVARSSIQRVQAMRGGGKAAAAQAPAPVTRADIEKFGMPILRAVIATRGADALLTISDRKGDVVTWTTSDGTTFSFRQGVLIQTRGLGPDLMSADAPLVAQLLQDGGTHPRQYFFLGADDGTTRRSYDCTVDVVGKETIEVFGRAHKVTKVSETCARPQGSITNEFWIEGQTVRKSRQLLSGGIGFVEFEQVVD